MTDDVKSKFKVAVVGGGIAGLASAYYLLKEARAAGLPVDVLLLEKENRVGGRIITEKVDGFTIEGGPDCFLRQKPWAAELVRELGLGEELMGTNDDRRKVFVLNKGKLTPLPDGVMLIVPTRIWPFVTSPLLSWPGKIRMGMDLIIPANKNGKDESIASFVRRRLGEEALQKIAEPLLSGIHVSDPEEQSLLATFPRFRNLEEKYGNLIFGMLEARKAARSHAAASSGPASIFITMKSGLYSFMDALYAEISALGGRVLTGWEAAKIEKNAAGFSIINERGEEIPADAVVLASPSNISAELVHAFAPGVSNRLNSIDYVSTATVSMAYREAEMGHALNGFGFVVPRGENRRISACTWTSTKFSNRVPAAQAMIRCFVGGPGKEEDVDLDDSSMLDLVKREVKELMGITAEPVLTRIYRWHKGNPQYKVGHLDRVQEIHKACDSMNGLFVTGSSYGGIGLPDCVRQGKETAQKVVKQLLPVRETLER